MDNGTVRKEGFLAVALAGPVAVARPVAVAVANSGGAESLHPKQNKKEFAIFFVLPKTVLANKISVSPVIKKG